MLTNGRVLLLNHKEDAIMEIKSVNDKSFKKYGKVLDGYDFTSLCAALEKIKLGDGVAYEPTVKLLENDAVYETLKDNFFGGMDIEIGYCAGKNNKLNAVEYHRCSEINVAARDMILLVGMLQDVGDDFTYDTANIEAFLLKKGCGVELYATTLHYAPVSVNGEEFRTAIVLPYGTNFDKHEIKEVSKEDKLMTAKNKWLIAHKDAHIDGAFEGLIGENITL